MEKLGQREFDDKYLDDKYTNVRLAEKNKRKIELMDLKWRKKYWINKSKEELDEKIFSFQRKHNYRDEWRELRLKWFQLSYFRFYVLRRDWMTLDELLKYDSRDVKKQKFQIFTREEAVNILKTERHNFKSLTWLAKKYNVSADYFYKYRKYVN